MQKIKFKWQTRNERKKILNDESTYDGYKRTINNANHKKFYP